MDVQYQAAPWRVNFKVRGNGPRNQVKSGTIPGCPDLPESGNRSLIPADSTLAFGIILPTHNVARAIGRLYLFGC